MDETKIRVGVLGCGNVGAALIQLIEDRGDDIVARTGLRLEVTRVAVRNVAKARPVEPAVLDELVIGLEDDFRLTGPEVTTADVGRAALERLREVDVVAAVRFASVYKEFDDLADFERELSELTGSRLEKSTEPKRIPPPP